MKLLQSKVFKDPILLVSLCPNMNLLAVLTEGQLLIYRSSTMTVIWCFRLEPERQRNEAKRGKRLKKKTVAPPSSSRVYPSSSSSSVGHSSTQLMGPSKEGECSSCYDGRREHNDHEDGPLLSCCWSPSGRIFVLASPCGDVHLYDVEEGHEVRRFHPGGKVRGKKREKFRENSNSNINSSNINQRSHQCVGQNEKAKEGDKTERNIEERDNTEEEKEFFDDQEEEEENEEDDENQSSQKVGQQDSPMDGIYHSVLPRYLRNALYPVQNPILVSTTPRTPVLAVHWTFSTAPVPSSFYRPLFSSLSSSFTATPSDVGGVMQGVGLDNCMINCFGSSLPFGGGGGTSGQAFRTVSSVQDGVLPLPSDVPISVWLGELFCPQQPQQNRDIKVHNGMETLDSKELFPSSSDEEEGENTQEGKANEETGNNGVEGNHTSSSYDDDDGEDNHHHRNYSHGGSSHRHTASWIEHQAAKTTTQISFLIILDVEGVLSLVLGGLFEVFSCRWSFPILPSFPRLPISGDISSLVFSREEKCGGYRKNGEVPSFSSRDQTYLPHSPSSLLPSDKFKTQEQPHDCCRKNSEEKEEEGKKKEEEFKGSPDDERSASDDNNRGRSITAINEDDCPSFPGPQSQGPRGGTLLKGFSARQVILSVVPTSFPCFPPPPAPPSVTSTAKCSSTPLATPPPRPNMFLSTRAFLDALWTSECVEGRRETTKKNTWNEKKEGEIEEKETNEISNNNAGSSPRAEERRSSGSPPFLSLRPPSFAMTRQNTLFCSPSSAVRPHHSLFFIFQPPFSSSSLPSNPQSLPSSATACRRAQGECLMELPLFDLLSEVLTPEVVARCVMEEYYRMAERTFSTLLHRYRAAYHNLLSLLGLPEAAPLLKEYLCGMVGGIHPSSSPSAFSQETPPSKRTATTDRATPTRRTSGVETVQEKGEVKERGYGTQGQGRRSRRNENNGSSSTSRSRRKSPDEGGHDDMIACARQMSMMEKRRALGDYFERLLTFGSAGLTVDEEIEEHDNRDRRRREKKGEKKDEKQKGGRTWMDLESDSGIKRIAKAEERLRGVTQQLLQWVPLVSYRGYDTAMWIAQRYPQQVPPLSSPSSSSSSPERGAKGKEQKETEKNLQPQEGNEQLKPPGKKGGERQHSHCPRPPSPTPHPSSFALGSSSLSVSCSSSLSSLSSSSFCSSVAPSFVLLFGALRRQAEILIRHVHEEASLISELLQWLVFMCGAESTMRLIIECHQPPPPPPPPHGKWTESEQYSHRSWNRKKVEEEEEEKVKFHHNRPDSWMNLVISNFIAETNRAPFFSSSARYPAKGTCGGDKRNVGKEGVHRTRRSSTRSSDKHHGTFSTGSSTSSPCPSNMEEEEKNFMEDEIEWMEEEEEDEEGGEMEQNLDEVMLAMRRKELREEREWFVNTFFSQGGSQQGLRTSVKRRPHLLHHHHHFYQLPTLQHSSGNNPEGIVLSRIRIAHILEEEEEEEEGGGGLPPCSSSLASSRTGEPSTRIDATQINIPLPSLSPSPSFSRPPPPLLSSPSVTSSLHPNLRQIMHDLSQQQRQYKQPLPAHRVPVIFQWLWKAEVAVEIMTRTLIYQQQIQKKMKTRKQVERLQVTRMETKKGKKKLIPTIPLQEKDLEVEEESSSDHKEAKKSTRGRNSSFSLPDCTCCGDSSSSTSSPPVHYSAFSYPFFLKTLSSWIPELAPSFHTDQTGKNKEKSFFGSSSCVCDTSVPASSFSSCCSGCCLPWSSSSFSSSSCIPWGVSLEADTLRLLTTDPGTWACWFDPLPLLHYSPVQLGGEDREGEVQSAREEFPCRLNAEVPFSHPSLYSGSQGKDRHCSCSPPPPPLPPDSNECNTNNSHNNTSSSGVGGRMPNDNDCKQVLEEERREPILQMEGKSLLSLPSSPSPPRASTPLHPYLHVHYSSSGGKEKEGKLKEDVDAHGHHLHTTSSSSSSSCSSSSVFSSLPFPKTTTTTAPGSHRNSTATITPILICSNNNNNNNNNNHHHHHGTSCASSPHTQKMIPGSTFPTSPLISPSNGHSSFSSSCSCSLCVPSFLEVFPMDSGTQLFLDPLSWMMASSVAPPPSTSSIAWAESAAFHRLVPPRAPRSLTEELNFQLCAKKKQIEKSIKDRIEQFYFHPNAEEEEEVGGLYLSPPQLEKTAEKELCRMKERDNEDNEEQEKTVLIMRLVNPLLCHESFSSSPSLIPSPPHVLPPVLPCTTKPTSSSTRRDSPFSLLHGNMNTMNSKSFFWDCLSTHDEVLEWWREAKATIPTAACHKRGKFLPPSLPPSLFRTIMCRMEENDQPVLSMSMWNLLPSFPSSTSTSPVTPSLPTPTTSRGGNTSHTHKIQVPGSLPSLTVERAVRRLELFPPALPRVTGRTGPPLHDDGVASAGSPAAWSEGSPHGRPHPFATASVDPAVLACAGGRGGGGASSSPSSAEGDGAILQTTITNNSTSTNSITTPSPNEHETHPLAKKKEKEQVLSNSISPGEKYYSPCLRGFQHLLRNQILLAFTTLIPSSFASPSSTSLSAPQDNNSVSTLFTLALIDSQGKILYVDSREREEEEEEEEHNDEEDEEIQSINDAHVVPYFASSAARRTSAGGGGDSLIGSRHSISGEGGGPGEAVTSRQKETVQEACREREEVKGQEWSPYPPEESSHTLFSEEEHKVPAILQRIFRTHFTFSHPLLMSVSTLKEIAVFASGNRLLVIDLYE